jgi:REP element-mobilizing transposase RayT
MCISQLSSFEDELPKKFHDRYRVPSARLRGYDYGQDGAYFVTICTKNRQSFFGTIPNIEELCNESESLIHYSDAGNIAYESWQKISDQFPFVRLGPSVIMPNHIHGIMIIDRDYGNGFNRDAMNRVSTGGITKYNNPIEFLHNNYADKTQYPLSHFLTQT